MTTLDAIQATARIATLPMKDRDHNVPRAIDTTVAINVPRMLRALRAVEATMDDLDAARAEGRIHTYGQIQKAVRDAIREALG